MTYKLYPHGVVRIGRHDDHPDVLHGWLAGAEGVRPDVMNPHTARGCLRALMSRRGVAEVMALATIGAASREVSP